MDKISELLAEAKPAYAARAKKRQFVFATALSVMCGVWLGVGNINPQKGISDSDFNAYYASLYVEDWDFNYGIESGNELPLDGYGLYEVS